MGQEVEFLKNLFEQISLHGYQVLQNYKSLVDLATTELHKNAYNLLFSKWGVDWRVTKFITDFSSGIFTRIPIEIKDSYTSSKLKKFFRLVRDSSPALAYYSTGGIQSYDSISSTSSFYTGQLITNFIASRIKGWKERKLVEKIGSDISKVDPYEFPYLVSKILGGHDGVEVRYVEGGSGDEGRDIEFLYSGKKFIVECKKWKDKIQAENMRSFLGAMNDHKADGGIYITASDFSRGARKLAKKHGILLVNRDYLKQIAKGDKSFVKKLKSM